MLKLSAQVQRVAEEIGIPLPDIEEMVKHSAICSHERGNRRWHGWLFHIEGNEVVTMGYLKPVRIQRGGTSGLTMLEECPTCEGAGCKLCGWVGLIQVEYH